ncbi:MAG: cobyrinate a,c-diamide synthase [Desulfobacteraceae bacterium]|nr:cobyrinate a,c-diamide synthase [Desulfobacteraceae bacterium]MBC2754425.1 cobyrinate a,c-diamide synthase [Desulfobacteraceae bacterium]
MQDDLPIEIPRVLIAALRGGSGKTVLSIGIIAALCNTGKKVVPFKKGPDYIDAGWLAMAAGRPCYNLDTFMADDRLVCRSFLSHTADSSNDIAVIEGNRGLYDGLDVAGSTSTASLSRLLNTPVILCLDCTKSTRTMAAVVLGCLHFEPEVEIMGVILNRIAGSRHENILRKSIETHCGVPVIGAVPKLKSRDFPERHMGLIPTPEHSWAKNSINAAADVVANHVNLPEVLRIAKTSENKPFSCSSDFSCSGDDALSVEIGSSRKKTQSTPQNHPKIPKIGIVKDSAFQFYYPDNLEALSSAGADLVYISPLTDAGLPAIDALYIGGGFPETHAKELAANQKFRNDINDAAESGLPIYAECGGLIYLGKSLVLDQVYPMTGVLPVEFGFSKKPQGHGYTIAVVDRENPFYEIGTILKGHEFHYSKVLEWHGSDQDMVFFMEKGHGIINKRDGLCYKNVFATYTHIHALGMPQWADTLVRLAKVFRLKTED